jgi:hypothetical protein
MNIFVLKNTSIIIYINHFLMNIFIKNKKSKFSLETVSLSKTDFFWREFHFLDETYLLSTYIFFVMSSVLLMCHFIKWK